MTVLITLTTAGLDAGPFDLYSNIDAYSVPFQTGVSKSALLGGYTSTIVPDSTTTVRVRSTGTCTNYIDIPIGGITTTMAPINMGLATEYETDAEACAGTNTIQTVTYFNNLQVGTVLSNFSGVSGNTGFFKITSNSSESQYVGQILGVNDDGEVESIVNICTTFNNVFIDGFTTAYGIVQNGVIDTDHETTYSFNLPAGNYEIKFEGTCIPASMGAIPGGFGAQTYSNGYIYFTETNGPTAENNILESNTDATLVGGTFPYNAVYASNTSSINTTNITVPTGGKTYWLRTLVITQIDNLSYSLNLSGVQFYITQL